VITGVARRRRFSAELKLAVVAETMRPRMSISYVARQHGLSPSLVFRWRRLMSGRGQKNRHCCRTRRCRAISGETMAMALGVARSNVIERRDDQRPRHGPQEPPDGVELAGAIHDLVDKRPT
jgi:transposase-like protein